MRRRFALLVLSLIAIPATASTNVPAPQNSTVSCVRACPDQDLVTTVTVRDFGDNPIIGATVVLDFSTCPGFVHCPIPQPPAPMLDYTWDASTRTARLVSGPDGGVSFFIKGGGVGSDGSVAVYADGVLLARRALFSPDQDGDLHPGPADQALLSAKLGTTDPTGDLDCDGSVTTADLTQFAWHLGHDCVRPTPVRTKTWGRLKQIYR